MVNPFNTHSVDSSPLNVTAEPVPPPLIMVVSMTSESVGSVDCNMTFLPPTLYARLWPNVADYAVTSCRGVWRQTVRRLNVYGAPQPESACVNRSMNSG